jgi:hypothetical protein
MVLIPTWTTCNTLLWVDFCLSKQSVTFPAQQPAKLTQRAEFGQQQSFKLFIIHVRAITYES